MWEIILTVVLSFAAGWLLRDITLKSYLYYLDGFRDSLMQDYSMLAAMSPEQLNEGGLELIEEELIKENQDDKNS